MKKLLLAGLAVTMLAAPALVATSAPSLAWSVADNAKNQGPNKQGNGANPTRGYKAHISRRGVSASYGDDGFFQEAYNRDQCGYGSNGC